MKEDFENLLRLQEIDRHISELKLSKEKIPQEIEEIEDLLGDKKADLEHAKQSVAELEKQKRVLENEIKDEEERIKKDRERLMQVKSNDEYHALLREIENSKKEVSERETGIIKLLDRMDDEKVKIDGVQNGLSTLEKELNEKKVEMEKFLKNVDAKIEEHSKEREEFVKKVKPALLSKYNVIKRKKNYNDVITRIVDGACSCCCMRVPPQVINEIRAFRNLHVCQTCERILYWSNEDEKNR